MKTLSLKLPSPRSLLQVAVDLAVDAAENAWSVPMFDILVEVFGQESWREACQRTLLRQKTATSSNLPKQRGGIFDLNTLSTFLARIPRVAPLSSLITTSICPSGKYSPRLSSPTHFQSLDIDDASVDTWDTLAVEDRSQWLQHLANIVFAFRQRWSHDNATVSPLECLDALLAMDDLSALLLAEENPSTQTVCHMASLAKAIQITEMLCKCQCQHTSMARTESAQVPCSLDTTLRIIAAQLVHTASPYIHAYLTSITPNSSGAGNMDWPELLTALIASKKQKAGTSPEQQRRSIVFPGHSSGQGPLYVSTFKGQAKHGHPLSQVMQSNLSKVKLVRKKAFHAGKLTFAQIKAGLCAGVELMNELEAPAEVSAYLRHLQFAMDSINSARKNNCIFNIIMEVEWMDSRVPKHEVRSGCDIPCTSHCYIQQPRAKPTFIGREELLCYLSRQLCTGKLLVLRGMPGSGKTATSIELAYKNRQSFPFQLWIPGTSAILVKWAMQRSSYILSHLRSHCRQLPDGQVSQSDMLIVVDGIKNPDIIKGFPKAVRQRNAIICTTWCDEASIDQADRLSRIVHVQPLPLNQVLTLFQSRVSKYITDRRALAELVVNSGSVALLENHLNQPLTVHTFISRLKHSGAPIVAEHLCNQYGSTRGSKEHAPGSSGDASLLHNDGYEVLLRHSLPRLTQEEKLLLLALSFLCRRQASMPWKIFGAQFSADFVHASTETALPFLTSRGETWQRNREVALKSLCNHGLVLFCPESACVSMDLLLQQHVSSLLGKGKPDGDIFATQLSAICNNLGCLVLQHCLDLYSSGAFSHCTKTEHVNVFTIIDAGESLLRTASNLRSDLEVQLRVWMARAHFHVMFEFEMAAEHYAQAQLELTPAEKENQIIIAMESGMVLLRCNEAKRALPQLQMALEVLTSHTEQFVRDPCIPCWHDAITLFNVLLSEICSARDSCGHVPSSPAIPHIMQPCVIEIGPLYLQSLFNNAISSTVQCCHLVFTGQLIEGCDFLLAEMAGVLMRGTNTATGVCLLMMATLLEVCSYCCDYIAFENYTELAVSMSYRTWEGMLMRYCDNQPSYHKVGYIIMRMSKALYEVQKMAECCRIMNIQIKALFKMILGKAGRIPLNKYFDFLRL